MNLHTNLNFFSVLFFLFILYLSTFPASSLSHSKTEDAEFGYKEGSSNGPEKWWRLNPKWTVCGKGKRQSPIDLSDKVVNQFPELGQLQKHYKPAPAVLKNIGHAIMVQWNGNAGKLNISGTYYELIQCHWHTPSEHTFNGTNFELELHAVHKNSKGEIAVIGIWYKIGRPDRLLSKLLKDLKSLGDKDIDLGVINPGIMEIGGRNYYRYVGSLTTPPCTEGLVWTIVKKVRTVSREQLRALKEAVHHGYEKNARPTQEPNGRQVWLYSHKRKRT
ncbi:alpha carbonic anhydrase 4-like [Vigna unguiculata]|uniref:Carbonic anhydrase n=1 Tax=Vigna unguiculata TaxID=3917 RepID=A0A4D6M6V5_VIGUN|nr:alpha carbonic anhydrase 4-like [Vigna unguiculata]QCD96975.1 carbonic anhydrase [Vigna unguiculata]QCD96976.1 carbonic anhydrase [Vigna unguiculata]